MQAVTGLMLGGEKNLLASHWHISRTKGQLHVDVNPTWVIALNTAQCNRTEELKLNQRQ